MYVSQKAGHDHLAMIIRQWLAEHDKSGLNIWHAYLRFIIWSLLTERACVSMTS